MANYNFNQLAPDTYVKLVKAQQVRPRFRLSILYPNESFKEDITDYLVDSSGRLEITYQQGQRRSLSFTLDNSSGRFTPSGIQGVLWLDSKFKLELGMEFSNGDVVWNTAGIFVTGQPTATRDDGEKTIEVQCYDKFAMIDGTLGGVFEATYQVDIDKKIYDVMRESLLQDNGNGYPIDPKPIIFDSSLIESKTQYTLSKSPNDSYGDLFIELAEMISCDIYYGVEGNLIVRSGIRDISQVNKPTLWTYSDKEWEYLSNNTSYDFTQVKNRVTVCGSNVNGDGIFISTAENTNPQSPTRISLIGTRQYYLEDSNISTEALAQQRAEYELNRLSILQQTISIDSSFMIHLDVNNCIALNDTFFDYSDDRFIIQSISIPISANSTITIECTNIASLPYYPS
jgi:hypothetical protein